MTTRHTFEPTLMTRPRSHCPRCDGPRVMALMAANVDDHFAWRECEDCGYLWALPRGLSPERAKATPGH